MKIKAITMHLDVPDTVPYSRPRKIWRECVRINRTVFNLTDANHFDWIAWRADVDWHCPLWSVGHLLVPSISKLDKEKRYQNQIVRFLILLFFIKRFPQNWVNILFQFQKKRKHARERYFSSSLCLSSSFFFLFFVIF